MRDVIVIGGGLFGSIIGKALSRQGRDVLVLDDGRPGSGSAAAGCLMKPAWLRKIGPDYDRVMRLLDSLYETFGPKTLTLLPGGIATAECNWVNPGEVLRGDEISYLKRIGKVTNIIEDRVIWTQNPDRPPGEWKLTDARAKLIILCTGIWANRLLPELSDLRVTAQWGASYRTPGKQIERPFIKLWAPYKQVIGFNFPDGGWLGDGRALVDTSASKCGVWEQSRQRCAETAGLNSGSLVETVGARPYCPSGDPAVIVQPRDNVFCITGGAKNGTAGAAWAALRMMEVR